MSRTIVQPTFLIRFPDTMPLTDTIPDRTELPADRTWDLSNLFETPEQWRTTLERTSERLNAVSVGPEVVTDGSKLAALLARFESTMQAVERVVAYAKLQRDVAVDDERAKERLSQARSLARDANSVNTDLERAIAKIGRDGVDTLVAESDALVPYQAYLHGVCRRVTDGATESTLDELETALSAPRRIYRAAVESMLEMPTIQVDGQDVPISSSNFMEYQHHPDREIRRRSYRALHNALGEVKPVIAAAQQYHFATMAGRAKVRGFDDTRSAHLHRNAIPTVVHDRLLDRIRSSLEPLHRHLRLQRRVLDVDDLRPWDLHARVHTEQPSLSYDKVKTHLLAAAEMLGDRYAEVVTSLFDDRRIDVHEHRGKRSGAYTRSLHGDRPYVLLNYQSDLQSAFTLAHEVGHAVQATLAAEAQWYVYADMHDPISEVPSIVTEIVFARQLIDEADSAPLRRRAREEYVFRLRNLLFRHAMLGSFDHCCQRRIADRGPGTAAVLDDRYRAALDEFYAPVVLDEDAASGWLRRRSLASPYDAYEYCFGTCVALKVADDIGEGTVQPFLEFLRLGSSTDSMTLLERLGVDPIDGDFVDSAVERYGQRVAQISSTFGTT